MTFSELKNVILTHNGALGKLLLKEIWDEKQVNGKIMADFDHEILEKVFMLKNKVHRSFII